MMQIFTTFPQSLTTVTMKATALAFGVVALMGNTTPATASQLGSDPIRLVIPYGPGGGSDITARILTATAPEFCGPRLDVISMSGAGGLEAVNFVLEAEPDGRTLLVSDPGPLVISGYVDDVNWGHSDWEPIMAFTEWLPVVYTRSDHTIQSIELWMERAQEEPETITVGHASPLGVDHLALILLEMQTGVRNVHVPTSGGGETRSLVMGGHIDLGMSLPVSIADQVEAGELSAIGVFSDQRSPELPDVPTFLEAGYDVTFPYWLMVFSTGAVPAETRELLQNCFLEGLSTDTAKSMSTRIKAGLDPRGIEAASKMYADTVESIGNILRAIDEIE